jgi:hypothetical protein
MEVLSESPELKSVIISSHGMLPILEILEVSERKDIILRLLKVINLVNLLACKGSFTNCEDHLRECRNA